MLSSSKITIFDTTPGTGTDEERTRALFLLIPRKNGDVILGHRSDSNFESNFSELKEKIQYAQQHDEFRITFHPSDKSESLSTIKRTLRTNSHTEESYLYTSAIKNGNKFQQVFARMCPRLTSDRANVKLKKDNCINIAKYDSGSFTFIYQLLVGSKDNIFKYRINKKNINVTQLCLNSFRFIIISTYLYRPSSSLGTIIEMSSFQANAKKGDKFVADEGVREMKAISNFKKARDYLVASNSLGRLQVTSNQAEREFIQNIRPIYVSDPTKNGKELDIALRKSLKTSNIIK